MLVLSQIKNQGEKGSKQWNLEELSSVPRMIMCSNVNQRALSLCTGASPFPLEAK